MILALGLKMLQRLDPGLFLLFKVAFRVEESILMFYVSANGDVFHWSYLRLKHPKFFIIIPVLSKSAAKNLVSSFEFFFHMNKSVHIFLLIQYHILILFSHAIQSIYIKPMIFGGLEIDGFSTGWHWSLETRFFWPIYFLSLLSKPH